MKKTIIAIVCTVIASAFFSQRAHAWLCLSWDDIFSTDTAKYSAYKVMDGANRYYVIYGTFKDSTVKLSDLKTFHQVYPSYPTGLGPEYTGSIFFELVKNEVIDERLVGWSWNPNITLSGCAASPGGAIAVVCTVMAQKDISGSEVFRCAMVSRLGSAVTADTPPNEVKMQIGTAQACVHKSPEITLEALLLNGEGKDPDADGWPNDFDNCDDDPNVDQADSNGTTDGDGVGDACEPTTDPNDSDGDTVLNSADNCPSLSNVDQADGDSDGVGNVCDNCPSASNADQADSNGTTDSDGVGDACEASVDSDGDGVLDAADECPGQGTAGSVDELGCPLAASPAAGAGGVSAQGKDEGGACALMPMAQPGIGLLMLLAAIVPLVIRRKV